MTGRTESEEKTKTTAVKTKSDKIVMKTKDLIVWDELAAARDSPSEPINIELRKGEILGVTGLDGHGHDEFVKILAGVQEPHAGTTEVLNINDKFVKYNTLLDAKKNGILLFQEIEKKKEYFLI